MLLDQREFSLQRTVHPLVFDFDLVLPVAGVTARKVNVVSTGCDDCLLERRELEDNMTQGVGVLGTNEAEPLAGLEIKRKHSHFGVWLGLEY